MERNMKHNKTHLSHVQLNNNYPFSLRIFSSKQDLFLGRPVDLAILSFGAFSHIGYAFSAGLVCSFYLIQYIRTICTVPNKFFFFIFILCFQMPLQNSMTRHTNQLTNKTASERSIEQKVKINNMLWENERIIKEKKPSWKWRKIGPLRVFFFSLFVTFLRWQMWLLLLPLEGKPKERSEFLRC